VLLCDPGSTKAAPLLAQLLIEPGIGLRRFWQRAGFGEMTLRELIEE
jgi:membrane protein